MRRIFFPAIALVLALGLALSMAVPVWTPVPAASPPEPTYGTATVDGDYGEWDLTGDFFANMYRAADPTKQVESKLYLRYDCLTGTMYALVLAVEGVPVLVQPDEAWIAINSINNKVVKGSSSNFAWVSQGYDSDPDHARGWEASFSLAPGSYLLWAHTNVYDDGESQTSGIWGADLVIQCAGEPATIGDFVWEDLNADGIQDAGEPGIAGVTVDLYYCNGTFVATTSTDAGGYYSFQVAPGDYYVEFTAPAGYQFSPQNQGSNDAVDSDADPGTGQTACTTLDSGESDLTWDAGLYQLATIGDFVWHDLNADGIQDAGEPGIAGVTVDLYDCNGTFVASTSTDASGYYSFQVMPGDYYVEFTAPAGYQFSPQNQGSNDAVDSDADPSTGQTACTTLDSGESDLTWDAGLYQLATIGDFVWEDLNADGIQDAGEPGIAGVTVDLYDCNGTFVASTSTDANGYYSFQVTPGDYYVKFTAPAGYVFSPQDQGSNDAVDSDAHPSTGQTACTTLDSGESDLTWDAGLNQLAIIGDFVWDDLNADGIQDAGEPGIAGVTVDLYDCNGTFVASTSTDANGYYSFQVTPGDYYVEFTAPAGYVFSPQDQGSNDAVDSDADPSTGQTACTTLDSGESDLTWDAGLYQLATIGDFVWDDLDAEDGIQDAGEPGVAGVTVDLYYCNGTFVASTITDANGWYSFQVTPGDYYLNFTAPAGYFFSPQNQGSDDAVDSDAHPISGQTACTTLDSGEIDLTWDAGLNSEPSQQPATIGDFVWEDLDHDGIQDAGEPGVEGVTVDLYYCNGTFVASTTTDANGWYSFQVMPGEYYLNFTLPAGYVFSPQDQGSNDAVDSDVDPITGQTACTTLDSGESDPTWDAGLDPGTAQEWAIIGDFLWDDLNHDGIQDAGEPGVGGVTVDLYYCNGTFVATTSTDASGHYSFQVTPGEYYVQFALPAGYVFTLQNQGSNDAVDSDVDPSTGRTVCTTLDSGEIDLTWDAGLDPGTAQELATIGDFVWDDLDHDGIQDAGEPGIAGVTVDLYYCNGTFVASTSTDASGHYSFQVAPGEYYVKFTLPAGYVFTLQNQGSDDEDSDAHPITGQTTCTTLDPGEIDLTWDAGLYGHRTIIDDFVWDDLDKDGIQDAGEPGIAGVRVDLYYCNGTFVATTSTDASGCYSFQAAPGDYYIKFTAPAGYVFSPQDQGLDDAVDSDADPATGKTVCITMEPGEIDLTWDAGLYQAEDSSWTCPIGPIVGRSALLGITLLAIITYAAVPRRPAA